MSDLKNKKLFLFDMDGTIYLDNDLFDGTLDMLEHIRKIGGKYIFLTNNSSKSVEKYIEKLASLGIESNADDFLTSTNATVLYLNNHPYKKIYALGTTSFKEQLRDASLPITDVLEDDIDCLLMGFDTELTFKKLEDACILLGRGVDYIATNPDWVCPTWYGYVPDCGSVSTMLYNATKRLPKFIGKPEPDMALLAMEKTGYSKDETVLLGDRLYTDIACGVNAGISTIFVLSGEGTLDDLAKSETKPEFVYENIRKVYEDIK
ncbi:MAG: HAD-IIA family hydrolase [Clostridia bacterium]|nr:HAD-IIA family hydrolase [Clostridia bacterium]MBR6603427.1 HAD-IIA family hydrolase [Clostridia bacterium]